VLISIVFVSAGMTYGSPGFLKAKRSSLELAIKQCLLSMKDTHDRNSSSKVFGFITTGEGWRMLKYDGASLIPQQSLWC
jgi:hypothetical protein